VKFLGARNNEHFHIVDYQIRRKQYTDDDMIIKDPKIGMNNLLMT
jgi:hypothetical protein